MLRKLSDLESILSKQKSKKKLVLCAAGDLHSIEAAIEAHNKNFVDTILVGDKNKIAEIANELDLNLEGIEIIHEQTLEDTVKTSVKLIHDGHADILMKGYLSTALMLKGVLNKDW